MQRIIAPPSAATLLAATAALALAAGGSEAAAQGTYVRSFERATTFATEYGHVWFMSTGAASGLPDLVLAKIGNTPNGHVEVHVAPGATQYQTRGLEIATTFAIEHDGVWGLVDTGASSLPDLYFIKTGNTPNGHVEVHIASAASNYQVRTMETATTFANEDDGVWTLVRSPAGGLPDLVYVKTRNTPNGRVEVHIASGASRYQQRVLEVPTTFASEENGTWGVVAGTGSYPDLYFIKTSNTPSGRVEVHIASGASRYQTRALETVTDFQNEVQGVWSLLPNRSRTAVPALAYIKVASTPNGHVEVHLAQFAPR